MWLRRGRDAFEDRDRFLQQGPPLCQPVPFFVEDAEIAERDGETHRVIPGALAEGGDGREIEALGFIQPIEPLHRRRKIRQRQAVTHGSRRLAVETGQRAVQQFGSLDSMVLVEQHQRKVGFPGHDIGMVRPKRRDIDRQRLPQQLFGTVERPGELQKRRKRIQRCGIARIGLAKLLARQGDDPLRDRHRVGIAAGVVGRVRLRHQPGEVVGGLRRWRGKQEAGDNQSQEAPERQSLRPCRVSSCRCGSGFRPSARRGRWRTGGR